MRYFSASSFLICTAAARNEAIDANDVVTTTPHDFGGPVDMRTTTPEDQGTQFVKPVAIGTGVGAAVGVAGAYALSGTQLDLEIKNAKKYKVMGEEIKNLEKALDEVKKATDLKTLKESQFTILQKFRDGKYTVKSLDDSDVSLDMKSFASEVTKGQYVVVDKETFEKLPYVLEQGTVKYTEDVIKNAAKEAETKLTDLVDKQKQLAPKFEFLELVDGTTDKFNVKVLDDLDLDTLVDNVKSGKYVSVDAEAFKNSKFFKATPGISFTLNSDELAEISVKQAARLTKFASGLSSKGAAVTALASAVIGASVGAIVAKMNDKKRRSLRSHQ